MVVRRRPSSGGSAALLSPAGACLSVCVFVCVCRGARVYGNPALARPCSRVPAERHPGERPWDQKCPLVCGRSWLRGSVPHGGRSRDSWATHRRALRVGARAVQLHPETRSLPVLGAWISVNSTGPGHPCLPTVCAGSSGPGLLGQLFGGSLSQIPSPPWRLCGVGGRAEKQHSGRCGPGIGPTPVTAADPTSHGSFAVGVKTRPHWNPVKEVGSHLGLPRSPTWCTGLSGPPPFLGCAHGWWLLRAATDRERPAGGGACVRPLSPPFLPPLELPGLRWQDRAGGRAGFPVRRSRGAPARTPVP